MSFPPQKLYWANDSETKKWITYTKDYNTYLNNKIANYTNINKILLFFRDLFMSSQMEGINMTEFSALAFH